MVVLFALLAVALIPFRIVNGFLVGRPRYPRVYGPYSDRFDFYEGRAAWEASCAGVPRDAVLLFSLHWAHLEIANGGFWQFFYNSTGVIAPEARDGFAAIGLPEAAAAIQSAMDKVGQPYPFDRAARQAVVGDPERRMEFEAEDGYFYREICNPKVIGGKPRYYDAADRYADHVAPEAA